MKTIKVYGIKWDTDGVPQEELGLPTDTEIQVSDKQYNEFCDDPDLLVNELSDTYGYCVDGYENDSLE